MQNLYIPKSSGITQEKIKLKYGSNSLFEVLPVSTLYESIVIGLEKSDFDQLLKKKTSKKSSSRKSNEYLNNEEEENYDYQNIEDGFRS